MKRVLFIILILGLFLINGCVKLPQACKADLRICPDGTSVGRDPSSKNCEEFYPCPKINQNNFNIYYSFGVGEKNVLDTKNNIYIKDMVCNTPKQYVIKLNTIERNQVYNAAIIGNGLLNLKSDFTKNCNLLGICQDLNPLETSTLKIEFDGKTKIIKWAANYYNNNDPDLKKLMNVEDIIKTLISQKELEMNIEQPKCGYL